MSKEIYIYILNNKKTTVQDEIKINNNKNSTLKFRREKYIYKK